jgi:L-Ala-D/L-Glu epimerase
MGTALVWNADGVLAGASMKLTTEPILLHPKRPFVTAKDQTNVSESVLVRIEHQGVVGLGEAKASADSCGGIGEDVCALAAGIEPLLGDDPFLVGDILDRAGAKLPQACCTLAGIDIALHDLCAKLLGVPLYRWFGLNPDRAPCTSYTLGIDSMDGVLAKLDEAGDFPILKIKVGFPGDVDIVAAIRQRTRSILRLDANGGWPVDEAVERIRAMEEFDIEFIEQPIPPGNPEALREIRRKIGVPLLVDEDAQKAADLPRLAGCVDGVNIKLMECGGLREALRMVHVARALGMRVMLGCMMESSLSLTAAAHLSPLADYGDLDSALLIDNDPFIGFGLEDGRIVLPDGPGIGARWRESGCSTRRPLDQ